MNFSKVLVYRILIGTILLVVPQAGLAANSADATGRYELGEIVVSGQGEAGVEATETLREVKADDIQSANARTLNEALALLPGVNVTTGGAGTARIDIRGFRPRHVLLLLDGIPINSAFDQQFDASLIPTENIESIKVTTGPSSVLYGQGGLAGVINIITKKGGRKVSGKIAGEAGDHEQYLGRASLGGGGEQYNYFLSGSAAKKTSYPLSGDFTPTTQQNGGYRNNSDWERKSLYANVGFAPRPDLTLGLTVTATRGSYGIPGSIYSSATDPFAAPQKFQRVDDIRGYTVQLAADYEVSRSLELRSWLYYNQLAELTNQYDNANLNSFNNALVSGSFSQAGTSTVRGISTQAKYRMGQAGSMTVGLMLENDAWDSSGWIKDVSATGTSGGGGRGGGGGGGGSTGQTAYTFESLNDTRSFSVYSAVMEYEVSPLPGLGLVAGFGQHWQNRTENSDSDYSWQAGAHYDLRPETRLKAAYHRNIRFPSISQLYSANGGNPDLQTEQASTYQIGLDQRLPGNSLATLTAFSTDAKNFIERNQGQINQNFSEYRYSGVEIAAETRAVKNLLLRASYAYLNSEDRTGVTGKDQVQYDPRDKAAVEGKYDFACGLTPYVSVLYVANQYYYSRTTPFMKAQLNDYTLVNAKLSQRLAGDKLILYIGASNLLDRNYEQSYGLPQAGRFIYGGVEIRL